MARRLGLETVSKRTNVSSRSRLEKNCQRLGLGRQTSRSRPITSRAQDQFSAKLCRQHLIKRTQCERALDAGGSEALTFSYQISALSKSRYYHIRELRCLRPYLGFKTASTIATSIVHSKLDYCNSLYYNLPQSWIKKLQNIQISLVRAVTRTPKSSHITPVLKFL